MNERLFQREPAPASASGFVTELYRLASEVEEQNPALAMALHLLIAAELAEMTGAFVLHNFRFAGHLARRFPIVLFRN